ncbi:serine carboxypeptidase II-3-like [Zingiber officinale]|uniref:serine carboxypeptidase II-3-like n=1 Tax=Zingiber officinale TaxID=94328 RepID=UPI001C4CF2E5|nr:serine carboxypeptidase II-3-like [Zingiber officinale]
MTTTYGGIPTWCGGSQLSTAFMWQNFPTALHISHMNKSSTSMPINVKPSFSCLFFLILRLLLFCFLHCVASSTTRQRDVLNKFYFNNGAERSSSSSWARSLLSVSDLESKAYDNSGLKEGDKVVRLPGQPEGVHFDQYAGYVTVDRANGRALFYYFVEAAENSGSKPIVLWLNGGPGCSSLGYGAMEELGPFRVMSDGKTLYRNPYAWNEVANVLFLESPAGVGFSYSNTTSDYATSGDRRTAIDALVFLVNWFERFPEYKGRDLFITGESYAGHYVPQLAHAILHHKDRLINLKGIAIGNAVIDEETSNKGLLDYYWTHAFLADETIVAIHKFCNFSPGAQLQPPECNRAIAEANHVFTEVNVYNIYAPLCFSSGVTPTPKLPSIENFDPCTSNYVEAYLNNPKVQKALHANVTKLNYTWSGCSKVIQGWLDQPSTMLPIIHELLSNGIRVLKYSGDLDGRVPVTSTRYSLNKLKLKVKVPWRAWMLNNEVGGYTVVYDHNLTFTTVRGAGHSVPSYQPARALEMIKSFLQGLHLPVILRN